MILPLTDPCDPVWAMKDADTSLLNFEQIYPAKNGSKPIVGALALQSLFSAMLEDGPGITLKKKSKIGYGPLEQEHTDGTRSAVCTLLRILLSSFFLKLDKTRVVLTKVTG